MSRLLRSVSRCPTILPRKPALPFAIRFQSTNPNPSASSDPFPLPLSKQLADQQNENFDDLLPSPIPRPNESIDALRARLVYQSRKRGMLEGDLLLSTFAQEHLPIMTVDELKEFDKLLDEPDWDIYYWSIHKRPPPERWANTKLLEKLRVHAKNEGRVVRKMPDLGPKIEQTLS